MLTVQRNNEHHDHWTFHASMWDIEAGYSLSWWMVKSVADVVFLFLLPPHQGNRLILGLYHHTAGFIDARFDRRYVVSCQEILQSAFGIDITVRSSLLQ